MGALSCVELRSAVLLACAVAADRMRRADPFDLPVLRGDLPEHAR